MQLTIDHRVKGEKEQFSQKEKYETSNFLFFLGCRKYPPASGS